MIKRIVRFVKDTHGAVTVDWVVLTAMAVGLALAGIVAIGDETTQLGADLGATIAAEDVSTAIPTGVAGAPTQ